jgi:hypothetical protein
MTALKWLDFKELAPVRPALLCRPQAPNAGRG